ncbi:MAG TPA: class I SAM-dependent methyltransferase [Candidatus Limnocylindrales bacterium]|nr:class I SAM-dependent methyltransferase [Candidatus Limnocylindrales bacterium]
MTSPYRSAAAFYASGRPPYSAALVPEVASRLGLDGTGAYLDAGCGPGILTLMFAPRLASAVGLDPSPDMLAAAPPAEGVRWVLGRAEDIPALGLGPFRLVTFGQSYQWTDRPLVASIIYDVLTPGGAMAVISHVPSTSPPPGPDLPPIPHDAIDDLLARFPGVGQRRQHGSGSAPPRHEVVLAASPFGPPSRIVLAGRADLIRTPDDILANLYSTSFAAPDRFGERRAEFEQELRTLLARHSPDGRFWEWPGDTEVLLAVR